MQKESDRLSASAGGADVVDTSDWEAKFAAVKELLPTFKAHKADEQAILAELQVCSLQPPHLLDGWWSRPSRGATVALLLSGKLLSSTVVTIAHV